MKSLLRYEIKRDGWLMLVTFISLAIVLMILSSIKQITINSTSIDIRGLKGMIWFVVMILILDRRSTLLGRDTVFENREHMLLIPKSILQIVIANCIVAYIQCIIFTLFFITIAEVDFYNINMLNSFVVTNAMFLFYVSITWIYVVIGKWVKKPFQASVIGGLIFVTPFFILVFMLNHTTIDGQFFYSIRWLLYTLLAILPIFGIIGMSATLGYKVR